MTTPRESESWGLVLVWLVIFFLGSWYVGTRFNAKPGNEKIKYSKSTDAFPEPKH